MTDLERYMHMIVNAGIIPVDDPRTSMIDGRIPVTVSMKSSKTAVGGYERYYTRHVFNQDGTLHRIEVFY
jgi:hypothetical protein